MLPFAYTRATTAKDATRAASPASHFIAGGTQLVDLMKLGATAPDRLVDINDLALSTIELGKDGLVLGALARMSAVERHEGVQRDYPVIAETMALAASPQIRNIASLAGNALQLTRCAYFRDTDWSQCNKRIPGSGCAALDGVNRKHAILGASDNCIATYPGDFAQALVALGAEVHIAGPGGDRTIPFEKLHTGPETPHVETVLKPGELITAFTVPAGAWTRRSVYVKVRDRESYAYGLATAAVALHLEGDTVREARIGLGGVAYRPWRAHEAEQAMRGKKFDESLAETAARAAFAGAKPRGQNAFKVDLGRRTLVRALIQASKMEG